MSYELSGCSEDFKIKKENFKKAFKALCNLNKQNELKDGFYIYNDQKQKPKNSKSVADNPNYHFIGLDWNYDETATDLEDILHQLNFEVGYDHKGNITHLEFHGNAGDEGTFLDALAPYVEEGGKINWHGEDDTFSRLLYTNKTVIYQDGHIVYE